MNIPPLLNRIQLSLLLISFLLMGLSTYLIGAHQSLSFVTEFYQLSHFLSEAVQPRLAAIVFLAAALFVALSFYHDKYKQILAILLSVMGVVVVVTLLSDKVWISSLGGFPAVGSGQGLIKYFALMAIALFYFKPQWLTTQQLIWLNFFPVALVYIWIGGMKFTLIEAQGIEGLIKTSPLMFWLYDVFDLQMTSNLIGLYDLLITGLLAYSLYSGRFLTQALLLTSSVFLVTQSFLLSFDGALSSDTLLSGTGQFVIKDLWFIVNLLIIKQLVDIRTKNI